MSAAPSAARAEAPRLPAIEPVDLRLDEISSAVRLRRAAAVTASVATHLGPVPLRWLASRGRRPLPTLLGRPLRRMVEDLGVTFVKLGQLLASSPSLAGDVLADALRGVLDDGPPVPFDQLRRIVEEDLGRPLEETFARFERTPFAAASLAVVHRAELIDGTPVAVKVLRPAAAASVAVDMSIVGPAVRWLARQLPIAGIPTLPDAVDGLAEQLAEELDLRNEARVMAWFAQVVELIGARRIRIPTNFDHASGRRVLTMEYVEGFPVDDLEAIAAGDVDASAAIEALIEAWFSVALCTGVFHGDMHAGNLLLTDAGEVVLLDWGIVGRLPEPSRRFFRRSLEGALGDETAWADVRDHMLDTFGADMLDQVGLSVEQFTELVRVQTMVIMNLPFDQVDLMMLMPGAQLPADEPVGMPRSPGAFARTLRRQRRRVRDSGTESLSALTQPRGELLLIKQLVFFERYGKLFLGDQPLLYDPDAYRALLAMPVFAAPEA